jgi:hypothetical protein
MFLDGSPTFPYMHPDELDRMADLLDGLGRQMPAVLDRLVAHHRPDVWRGARARQFGAGLADERVRVRTAADRLAEDARRLRAQAATLRAAAAP